ncbi:MAG: beta-1,6-N-acetylglucosaminyltransferase [Nocardioidaceae bacterium]
MRRIRSLSPDSIIMLSHQTGGEPLDHTALGTVGNVHVLPTPGGYGDFSHVDRYLESAQWLIDNDEPFDWFINLSAQDYPIVNLRDAERELGQVDEDAMVETFSVFSDGSHWPLHRALLRYNYRHTSLGRVTPRRYARTRALGVVNLVQPWIRFSPAYLTIGVRATMPFTSEFVCYGGSFFANLSRRAVLEVIDFGERRPEFVAWARRVVAPEEIYLQTVLGNAPDLTVRNDSLRYFDFSASRANHPNVLTEADLPAMLASGAWFARKFDQDAPVLDRLDGLLDAYV